jgi:hypothetical protein
MKRALWRLIRDLLRRLFARPDPVLRRLDRLRAIYRSDSEAGLHSRRVRDVLRGHVAPGYQTHYDRLLRVERATSDLVRHDVRPALPDLLPHVHSLTERVVRLIEQLQRGDQVLDLYPDGTTARELVEDARRRLVTRIDEAIALQENIPARLMQLSVASSARELNQLRERLSNMSARLEGMADSYERLSLETTWQQRITYEDRQLDQNVHHKE